MTDLPNLLLDPVITRALGAAISVIFIVGAWQKLKDRDMFMSAVAGYQLLPERWLGLFAVTLPLAELAAGILLLPGATRLIGGAAGVALLTVVTGAVLINLMRGRYDIDCGCAGLSGHLGEQTLSWGLVVRNAVLMMGLIVSVAEPVQRQLVWIDFLSVAGATLALLGLYVSANQLMANHPRLQSLRTY